MARAERVRRQVLVATGLWPMPAKTPANAVVHGRVDRDGYTVERVYLESFPGHFVTGSLYRPKGRGGKLPGVLCPHGHWPNGRFYATDEKKIRWDLVEGAERFEVGGRYPVQARCMQLARMGCVVFHYDMVGYADSVQLAHGPGFRPAMSTPENWGYFSPQAEARLQTMMGLQTYNSLRAFDWLSSREDVDPQRMSLWFGPVLGTLVFIALSPYAQARFVYPAFTLWFLAACAALPGRLSWVAVGGMALASVLTAFDRAGAWWFIAIGLLVAVCAVVVLAPRKVTQMALAGASVCLVGFAFVYWHGYVSMCEQLACDAWEYSYGPVAQVWAALREKQAGEPDATVAYTAAPQVYALYGPRLGSRQARDPAAVRLTADRDLDAAMAAAGRSSLMSSWIALKVATSPSIASATTTTTRKRDRKRRTRVGALTWASRMTSSSVIVCAI